MLLHNAHHGRDEPAYFLLRENRETRCSIIDRILISLFETFGHPQEDPRYQMEIINYALVPCRSSTSGIISNKLSVCRARNKNKTWN